MAVTVNRQISDSAIKLGNLEVSKIETVADGVLCGGEVSINGKPVKCRSLVIRMSPDFIWTFEVVAFPEEPDVGG